MTREELQHIVAKEGLQVVADRIGYHKSAVCHVVQDNYKGRADRILKAAEGKYSQELVACPVLGEIVLSRCIEEKARPFAAVNPVRVQLFRACRNCGMRNADFGIKGKKEVER